MVVLAVNGTLMRGLGLNKNMLDAGAEFIEESKTSQEYRLWSINDIHPGMIKVPASFPVRAEGTACMVELELWEVPAVALVGILTKEPPGLCIGTITLVDGREVLGVLCEPWRTFGMREITPFGGWRKYCSSTSFGNPSAPSLATGLLPPSLPCPIHVDSNPYKWPFDGCLQPYNTALCIIDMQVDFCAKGGYVDLMGYDLNATRKPIEPLQRLLKCFRAAGFFVMHTREGHRRDLKNLPANKLWRSEKVGAGIGSVGPHGGRILTIGEPGWEIIPELAPMEGEPVIDKPGKGTFVGTDLDLILRTNGIRNIIFAGVTTDVCVHTTMRDANDMGYECLLLTDGTGATDQGNHDAACKMVTMQGGVFGALATADQVIAAVHGATMHAELERSFSGGKSATIPEALPYEFKFSTGKTALVMIDFQRDFCLPGGFGFSKGNKVENVTACIPQATKLLAAVRAADMVVIHTLESHSPTLDDCPTSKLTRGNPVEGDRIGDKGEMGRILVRGEYGNGIVDEVAPIEGEKLLYKPGKGAFWATELHAHLQARGVTHLLFAGVTTDVCVQTSMREGNDRGYECAVVEDATASYFPEFKKATLEMIRAQGGIVGWTVTTDQVCAALQRVQ